MTAAFPGFSNPNKYQFWCDYELHITYEQVVPTMTDSKELPLELIRHMDKICSQFEQAWKAGKSPQIEDFLSQVAIEGRDVKLRQLIAIEVELLSQTGKTVNRDDYIKRFGTTDAVEKAFSDLIQVDDELQSGSVTIIQYEEAISPPPKSPPGDTSKNKSKITKISESITQIGLATLVISERLFQHIDTADHDSSNFEYQISRTLGQGGMEIVYEARQTSLDRVVAVKMLSPAAMKKRGSAGAFLVEAVITGELDHPNIVPIYDVGRNDNGELFYSMKCVHGTPWSDVIESKSIDENVDILMRVADAVAFAHSHQILHRDLKPSNTMLGEFGEVLVMDWGLALPIHTHARLAGCTVAGGGTPSYMSPEMATGPLEKIGEWSDVYLLGAVLFQIVTGKPPHSGKSRINFLQSIERNEIVATDRQCDWTTHRYRGIDDGNEPRC